MTDWTIATDEEADARRRTGAIDGRYQLCQPTEGMIACFDRLHEAFAAGDAFEMWADPPSGYPPYTVEVYDRMARQGQPRTWRRQPRKGGTYCMEHGDKFSTHGRWKCVDKRGMTPATDDLTSQLWR